MSALYAPPGSRFPADETPIAEIMTRDVVAVAPSMPLEELAALLLERGITGAPVVDDEGRPIGMVSKTDLLWEQRSQLDGQPRPTVDGIMSTSMVTLAESATIARAAAVMAYEGIHRIPIVAPDGRLVGQVSALDVLAWLGRHEGYVVTQVAHVSPAGERKP